MRYCISIRGKVQGVWFRKHAHDKAMSLGLKGFVKNLPDGSVYCEVEGGLAHLEAFADWCSTGSPLSEVSGVAVSREENAGFHTFEIVG